jgi:hypothetical protein
MLEFVVVPSRNIACRNRGCSFIQKPDNFLLLCMLEATVGSNYEQE